MPGRLRVQPKFPRRRSASCKRRYPPYLGLNAAQGGDRPRERFILKRFSSECRMSLTITLTINGIGRTVELDDPRITLLDLLRERLQLTGTKKGCDRG